MSCSHKRPPGPRTLNPLGSLLTFRRDPLAYLTGLTRQYGDMVRFSLCTRSVYFFNHPDYLKHILQEKSANYDKDMYAYWFLSLVTGNGLVSNVGGSSWLRQRRLIQPAFHKRVVAEFGSLMLAETLAMLEGWETCVSVGRPISIEDEMEKLALRIVSKAIFCNDFARQSHTIIRCAREGNQFLGKYTRLPFPPLCVPTARNRRFHSVLRDIDALIYDFIQQYRERPRRERPREEEDYNLLAMLLNAVDAETGERMSDLQIRDEVITFLFAGYETSAKTLTWMWYLLSQHPRVEARLQHELQEVLGGRLPTVEDLFRLPYARMVIDETLRLYPPVWLLGRNTVQDDTVDGYYVPAKTSIIFSPYIIQRHPAFWEEPESFCPERFAPERRGDLSNYAYLPFLNGPRLCIGQSFALQEMLIILALVAQRYRLIPAPGQHVEILPLVSLGMREELLMHGFKIDTIC